MTQARLLWLPDVLRDAGCTVIEHDGWKTRSRPSGDFDPKGIMLHHDASPAGASSTAVHVIINGRTGLPGPLSQLWLDYWGRWHIVAAGRANHAGLGQWGDCPTNAGNAYFLGIESDHTTDEQWTGDQEDYGTRGVVALCDKLGIRGDAATLRKRLCAHKEYAPNRKADPHPMNMANFRATILRGAQPITPQPQEPEEGFVDQVRMSSDTEQVVKAGQWVTLRTQDEADGGPFYAATKGRANFVLTMALTTKSGLTPGKSLMLRAINQIGTTEIKGVHPIEQYSPTDAGPQHFAYTAQGLVAEGQWLRVQLNADEEVTITKAETRVTTW